VIFFVEFRIRELPAPRQLLAPGVSGSSAVGIAELIGGETDFLLFLQE